MSRLPTEDNSSPLPPIPPKIDWQGGYLTVREAKDGEFRRIIMHPAVITYLESKQKPAGMIFDLDNPYKHECNAPQGVVERRK